MRAINRDLLGVSMVQYLDRLARNAFLSGTFTMYGKDWNKADFGELVAAAGEDDFNPAISDEIFLGMQSRQMHGAVDAVTGSTEGTVIALTTPGVVYTMQRDTSTNGWIDRNKYANPSALLRYEVGSYRNVRYLATPELTLWNAGEISSRLTVVDPVYPGSGAARNVDANRVVGQETLINGTRYIQFDSLDDLSQIAVNDMLTMHRVFTDAHGVTNGVDPYAGANIHRRVVSVDDTEKRIAFDRPVLTDDYQTDLGGGVYGYVTKAVNVHPVIFLTGANSVVAGVTQSPQVYTPPIIDDVMAFHRFSWDAYLQYQIWNDAAVEVSFHTAPYRLKGASRY